MHPWSTTHTPRNCTWYWCRPLHAKLWWSKNFAECVRRCPTCYAIGLHSGFSLWLISNSVMRQQIFSQPKLPKLQPPTLGPSLVFPMQLMVKPPNFSFVHLQKLDCTCSIKSVQPTDIHGENQRHTWHWQTIYSKPRPEPYSKGTQTSSNLLGTNAYSDFLQPIYILCMFMLPCQGSPSSLL